MTWPKVTSDACEEAVELLLGHFGFPTSCLLTAPLTAQPLAAAQEGETTGWFSVE